MLEHKNRFAKHDAARAAQRNANHGVSRSDAITTREQVRETWRSHGRTQPGSVGLLLDARTKEAKIAALADRRKTAPEATHIAESTVFAILETWLRRNPNFYDSDFNGISLRNFLLKAWHEKGLAPTIELLDSAFAWLQANGHLEADPRIPRKRGDVARTAAARLFEYTKPEEIEELEQKNASEAVEKRKREDSENRALTLEELRQKARATRGIVSRDKIMAFQG